MSNKKSTKLNPWEVKAYELIYHAEIHYRRGSDYDRRLALISFDNAIEVSIVIYLSLNPKLRGDKDYPKKSVRDWLRNYHTKLDFFFGEIEQRELPIYHDKESVIWYHEQRNKQYHEGGSGVPDLATLKNIRGAAIWFFSILFEFSDVESYLDSDIEDEQPTKPTIPDEYVVPESSDLQFELDTEQGQALSATAIVGGWDENNPEDVEIVKRLIDGL